MADIESMEQISELIRKGETNWKQYGDVYTNETDELILFNYTPEAQYAGRWNWFERHARGLIFSKRTGQVVAYPFPKFWNWGENDRKASGHITCITEKLDGSLGIGYWHNGRFHMATRGSLTSDQAKAGEAWFCMHMLELGWPEYPGYLTLLFEIILPWNRVVVNYGKRAECVLLGAIDRRNGRELDFYTEVIPLAHYLCLNVPQVYTFNTIEDIIAAAGALDGNHEGWVVTFSDGSRWKFKGDRYRELHKLITGLSKKRVFEAMRDHNYIDLVTRVPEEFRKDVEQWHFEIECLRVDLISEVTDTYEKSPVRGGHVIIPRKEFARWVTEFHPRWLQNILFLLYDERPIEDMIWKRVEELLGEKENA